jgi:hypothetical protein
MVPATGVTHRYHGKLRIIDGRRIMPVLSEHRLGKESSRDIAQSAMGENGTARVWF